MRTNLQLVALGVILGYFGHAFRVSRDPKHFIEALRAQLEREEGLAPKGAATPTAAAEG